ncbi:MAG: DNRLRE domain-containing protein [Prosthecobacter sp.]|uniref:DNRLRE domain-containing protein n=1 Tax=Prosthecobacter sp. TaxID=1965333 RepID=UPI003BAEA60A
MNPILPPLVRLCLVMGLLGMPAMGATFVATAAADTSIYQNHPDYNLGGTTLVSGTNQQFSNSRALFSFDLSAVPAGAIVTSVQVSLYVTRRPDPDQHGGPVNSDFSLYRALQSWTEGTGSAVTGSPASTGDTTWNNLHYNTTGDNWATPGGQIGTDFASVPSATTSVGDVGLYLWGSSPDLVADVQSWLDSPSTNNGFALISESENVAGTARRFASAEQPGGGIPAPTLSVTYEMAPEPDRLLLLFIGAAAATFRRRTSRRLNE